MNVRFSDIGLGGGALGDPGVDADTLVRNALDRGVTVFDTARSYGASEERLGRALEGRRREAVIVTKGGYGIAGVADWTGECIRRGVDEALTRLRTDYIDAFVLHSCNRDVLARSGVVEELVRAREAGKVQLIGYSGEGDALAWAADRREIFSVLECSLNPFDTTNLGLIERARRESFCVLIKRPLANAPWRFSERPSREDIAIYWDRMKALDIDPSPLDWVELALRFVLTSRGVTTALVGTSRLEHLEEALSAASRGPLPDDTARAILDAIARRGADWQGVI
jgi:aryl-alcohol dehydrogenase-like predicted oxidoreductase